MTFQSLYRKHRPQRFDELLGQGHVTAAVRHAVRDGRVGHAYLFSGPRGTGKTTMARILAKALNCVDRAPEGEPCGSCDSCVEIARGTSMDVIELDAASNNSVAEMRALLERVAFRTAGGHRRVYIVDEVHMLTAAASNALLKTLEEPPDHVVFVLATTEPEKVLPTIRSRTQHFEFRLLPVDDVAAYLATVAEHEKIEVDERTLHLVARRGGGSVRDALSLLDQAVALGEGSVDAAAVQALFEATPFDRIAGLVDAVAGEDVAGVLSGLGAILDAGADPRLVVDDLLRYFRNVYVVAASRGQAEIGVLSEERERLESHGRDLGAAAVERALETLGTAAVDMRRAPDPRLVLEVALVRLARREAGTRVEALLDRVERLERALEEVREGRGSLGAAMASSAPPTAEPTGTADEPGVATRPALGALRERRASQGDTPGGETTEPEGDPVPVDEPAGDPVATEDSAGRSGPSASSRPSGPSASSSPSGAEPSSGALPDLDLDDVVLAWPNVLEELKPVLKAIAREAQPVALEGATVVLGLAPTVASQRPRLERDLGTITGRLREVLGRGDVDLRIEEHEGFLDEPPRISGAATDPGHVPRDPTGDRPTGDRPAGDPDHTVGMDDPVEGVPAEGVPAEGVPAESAPQAGVDSIERLIEAFDATVEPDDEAGANDR